MIYKKKISQEARKKIIVKANSLGGAHIGGSFSILDFLISFYLNNLKLISKDKMSDYYYGISNSSNFNLIFSILDNFLIFFLFFNCLKII